jgi:hypothetical protein
MMTFELRSGLELDDRDAGDAGLESTLTSQEPVKPEVVGSAQTIAFPIMSGGVSHCNYRALGGSCASESQDNVRGPGNGSLFRVTSVTERGTHLGYYVPGREA